MSEGPPQEKDPGDFSAQLATLNARFAAQLEGTLKELGKKVAAQQNADVAPALLKELHARLHQLAGSGGTFGFAELSSQARALEVSAKGWLDCAMSPTPNEWAVWKTALQALHQTLARPAAPDSSVAHPVTASLAPGGATRIVLIDDDLDYGAELCLGLSQFGYEVTHYPDFALAGPAIVANPPDVLVVDIMLTGASPADGTQAVSTLFTQMGRRLPCIFMTSRIDCAARLAAASAGGNAFLLKPVDAPSMANRIEMLIEDCEKTPYRVLIVDDDEVLPEHYRLALSSVGMLAEKACNPDQMWEALERLRPDLILMDLYMPECSGADLARAIRYDPAWESVPIVYLSGEGELEAQLKAMDSGADDFITKPISVARLIGLVRARAKRARKLAELMSQDSLTGLLKHASIKERLVQEVDRAKRHQQPLSVVMVDIDFFKKVNDSYGHPVGDQVIKTLAHLLRQRLRRQDCIGRYGGEEFAAIMPECDAQDAVRMVDDIRQRFSEVRFIHQGQSFSVTLSAGVASVNNDSDAPRLLAAADAALYTAKHGGRNQVRAAQFDSSLESAP